MKLFLIDGHALIFKMYYAFLGRPMVNTKGVDTSILFGFTKYLMELIAREHPSHIAVSFDPPGGTFRNVMYPAYKANRAETPQLVIDALDPLASIVKALNIPVLMIMGFEADDVIGSAARRFAAEGLDVYMVTPDKDYGQLVAPHIYQYKPGRAGSDNEILGIPEICTKWSISDPSKVIDMLSLCGDSSDNIPGVQGIGPVGAAKLLGKYGSVKGIYDHISELTPKQQEMFRAAQDHIDLSEKLVTIKTDIPLPVAKEDLVFDAGYSPELEALLDRYEFPSLKRLAVEITGQCAPAAEAAKEAAPCPEASETGNDDFLARHRSGPVAFDLGEGEIYLASDDDYTCGLPSRFKDFLENAGTAKDGVDIKAQKNKLAGKGIVLDGYFRDIELMHYLLNPERSHKLDSLAASYLGISMDDEAAASTGSLFDETPEPSERNLGREASVIHRLADKLSEELDGTEGMRSLYDKIEEPLISVLSRMEQAGVKVDVGSLNEFAEGLRVQMHRREEEVRTLAGDPELNVSSPKQVGTVIFEKLDLDPRARKPKSGNWPTDEQTLLDLSDRSPIIDAILDYRGLRKLLTTYIEPFSGYVSPLDGRVHTTFNQALTSTGRLSSSNPNLQNIPVRTDRGREIRKAFVAGDPGSVMMSADYSQIELRLMAHFSGDAHLIDAFRHGLDVHSATAAKIFHEDIADVTPDQRRVAKTANFGIMYGISAFGLSQRLRCPRAEAKKIIDDYFASFPSIRGFIDNTLEDARRSGYVETLFGRRRYLPDLNSHNATVRSLAERNAVNAPIQGTAADIIKLAMIGVDRSLLEGGLRSRMVLQIHDELLLEVPENEIDTVKQILVREMEGVAKLSVPLSIECNYGKNWLDAH